MTSRSIRNRLAESSSLWPGFVDVLATLLIVIIFVLMVFTVSQIYLSDAISGRDKALEELRNKINELSKILVVETKEKEKVKQNLETEKKLNLELETQISEDQATITSQNLNISLLGDKIDDLLLELKIVAKALETYEGLEITSLDTQGLGERINRALAARIDQLNDMNQKLAFSQQETAEQLRIVEDLNENLIAINKGLGLEDASLVEQLEAISNKNNQLALANEQISKQLEVISNKNNQLALANEQISKQLEAISNKNTQLALANENLNISKKKVIEQLKIVEELNTKLSINEKVLQNQISQYQVLTEELIALNESLDLKDKTLVEQLEQIKYKNEELALLNQSLIAKDTTIFDLRGKILELNNILSISEESQRINESEIISLSEKIELLEKESDKTSISKKSEIDELNLKIATLESEKKQLLENSNREILEAKIKASATLEQVAYLTNEIEVLKKEIEILNSALEASEQSALTKELKIEVLGEKLNKALTSKVFELQKYRSEFFGRLQSLLGDRKDIKVVGDRFIFESELLFDSGSATLQAEGREKLKLIGLTLKETTSSIPNDIDWIIQVEGHTDKNPINTLKFPSNWELSTARANTVLKLLLDLGFSPQHLSAAGYGEFYPISNGNTNEDFQQNRRIELKLTSR